MEAPEQPDVRSASVNGSIRQREPGGERGVVGRWIEWLRGAWARFVRRRTAERPRVVEVALPPLAELAPIERLVLADHVAETLFADFDEHRASPRGDEEIGWLLVGRREARQVVALAALPVSAERDAGTTHVWIRSDAHLPACRLLRQIDRRLGIVGVVHTHPGSLRTPSGGDYHGDVAWVAQLRGGEGVFAIGTADASAHPTRVDAERPDRLARGRIRFSWYALGASDANYRRLPVELIVGPDLATPFAPLWPTLERHGPAIERLCRQLSGLRLELLGAGSETTLALAVPTGRTDQRVRVLIQGPVVRYYVEEGDALAEVDPRASETGDSVERSVFLILAELARRYDADL